MKVSEYLDSKGFDYEVKTRPSGDNYIMICPFCGGGKEKRKTFAINSNSGLWNCKRKNHCNQHGTFYQLQERLGDKPIKLDPFVNKKKPSNKKYEVPKVVKIPLSDSSIKYLKEIRCFSDEMIKLFDLFEDVQGKIALPYYKDGKIVNIKYRSKYKKHDMRQVSGAEPVLFNRDRVEGNELLIVVEGECLCKGTEILTPSGWLKLDNYSGEDVLQYNKDGSGNFVKPLAYIKKKYKGKLIKHEVKGYISITTPKHNLVSIDIKGKIRKHSADNRYSRTDIIPRTLKLDNFGINLTNNQIALCLAVSADFSIDYRENGGRYARATFFKQRKINRIRKILNNVNIKASDNIIKNNSTSICFSMPKWITERILPIEWIEKATLKQRRFIIEELINWDGNKVKNRNQYEYSSKYYKNALWVQTMAHTCGYSSTIIKRKNKYGEWYKVSILLNKNHSSWQCMHTSKIDYNDYVYCVQVPSGMIMVRQENKITITGNCDCIALTQYGIKNVVSVPNGVDDLRWIENEWDFLDKFKEIYLMMDNDDAGQRVVQTLVNRLGIWRCKSITLPYKDANDCLKFGVTNKEIFECFQNAEEFTPVEIKSAGDFCGEVIDIFQNPDRYKGLPTGFPELDKIIRGWRDGELNIWTGQSGSGKTTLLNQCCLYQASKGIKCCIASLELRPARYLKWAIQQALGKEDPTEEEIIKAFEWLDEWIYVLDINDRVYASKILDLFEYTARKHGIKIFVIDSLMQIRLKGSDDDMSQVEFVDDYRNFGKRFQVSTHLVAHPRKKESDKDKPDKTDVKGRGEITDKADNVITIWRNVDDDDEDLEENEKIDGLLIIRKNREFGDLGSIQLYFDPESRRYRCYGQHKFFD